MKTRPAWTKLLTRDEARRILATVVKLLELLGSKKLDRLRLPLPAPASQSHCVKAGDEKADGL